MRALVGELISLRVASAGFQSQWLLSELAFHYLDHTDADKAGVAAGAVLAHLGITAVEFLAKFPGQ